MTVFWRTLLLHAHVAGLPQAGSRIIGKRSCSSVRAFAMCLSVCPLARFLEGSGREQASWTYVMLHWLPSYFFWLAASVRGMAGVAWSKRKPACTALLIPSLRAWGVS